jgi:anti-anti-sigma factor
MRIVEPFTVTSSCSGRTGARAANAAVALECRLRRSWTARGLVLDCREVTALGSAAVRALLRASRRLAGSGGKLQLLNLSPKLLRTLQVSGFDRDFTVAPSLEETLGEPADAAAAQRGLAASLLQLMGAPPLALDVAQDRRLAGIHAALAAVLTPLGTPSRDRNPRSG